MLDELPPITTFLNRVLALPIALQNSFFELFEELLAIRVEAAIASGTYDVGLETLIAESLTVTDRRVLHTHERTGATTMLLTIRREDKNEPLGLEAVLSLAQSSNSPFLINTSSNRAALGAPASSLTLEDGSVEERVRLIRPLSRDAVSKARLADSHWQIATRGRVRASLAKRARRNSADAFERDPSRHRPAAAGLETSAARQQQGLPARNRRRRTHRRPPDPDRPTFRNLRAAFNLDGGPALSAEDAHRLLTFRLAAHRTAQRPWLAPFDVDGRQAHRADRLPRHRGRAAQSLRLLQRNHLLAFAAVSADRDRNRRRCAHAPLRALSAIDRSRRRRKPRRDVP